MQNNLPQFERVLDCLSSTLGSDFLENCGLIVPNFLRFSSLCLDTSQAYFPTGKVRKLLSSRENGAWVGQVNILKEFDGFLVLIFFPWNSLWRLQQPLFHDPSAFCREKCAQAGMERDRSGVVENTVPFDIWKFGKSNRNFWSNGTRPSITIICLFSILLWTSDRSSYWKSTVWIAAQDIWAWCTEYLLKDTSLKFLVLLPVSNLVLFEKMPVRLKKKPQQRAGDVSF